LDRLVINMQLCKKCEHYNTKMNVCTKIHHNNIKQFTNRILIIPQYYEPKNNKCDGFKQKQQKNILTMFSSEIFCFIIIILTGIIIFF